MIHKFQKKPHNFKMFSQHALKGRPDVDFRFLNPATDSISNPLPDMMLDIYFRKNINQNIKIPAYFQCAEQSFSSYKQLHRKDIMVELINGNIERTPVPKKKIIITKVSVKREINILKE